MPGLVVDFYTSFIGEGAHLIVKDALMGLCLNGGDSVDNVKGELKCCVLGYVSKIFKDPLFQNVFTFLPFLLRIAGSGKSTFLKQLRLIHKQPWTKEELDTCALVLKRDMLVGIKELVSYCEKEDIQVRTFFLFFLKNWFFN